MIMVHYVIYNLFTKQQNFQTKKFTAVADGKCGLNG